MKETEIAALVVQELRRLGYTVYQEVSLGYGSKRADIVARLGPVLTVIEVKRSLSLALLDQCFYWQHHGLANRVIAAHGSHRLTPSVERFCAWQGLGIIKSSQERGYKEQIRPRTQRRRSDRLLKALRPEQLTGEFLDAGSQGGGYWTPFRATARAVEHAVASNPGITMRQLMKLIDHHYTSDSSACSALPELIRRGVIPLVRLEPGRPLRIYPTEPADA